MVPTHAEDCIGTTTTYTHIQTGFNWHNTVFPWMQNGNEQFVSYHTPVAIMWSANIMALASITSYAGAYKMTIFAALFIWFMAFDVFFMEIQSNSSSWYLLDLFQQSIALYFQKVVQISQHLDVFHRLDEGIDNGQQRLTAWFVGWEGSGVRKRERVCVSLLWCECVSVCVTLCVCVCVCVCERERERERERESVVYWYSI